MRDDLTFHSQVGRSVPFADLVSTGGTLKEDDLAEIAMIMAVSARLIFNGFALKDDAREIQLVERFRDIADTSVA